MRSRRSALGLMLPILMAACVGLSGCDRLGIGAKTPSFDNTDVTGLGYAKDFALPDVHGAMRRLADFRGKAVVVFFGYTHCPDVCPTTLAELAAAMKQLGPLAGRVQVLFVTLDPERDTPAVLANYLEAFDPRFVGLVGSPEQTEKVAKAFKVYYNKVPGKEAGSYSVDHSAGSYVFDPQGHLRLFMRFGQGPTPIVHDLKLLLS